MTNNLLLSLQITVLGMGLVFGAILALWALIGLIVRFTSNNRDTSAGDDEISTSEAPDQDRELTDMEMKHLAASTAVAIALARCAQDSEPHPFPLPPTPIVSAWQAVLRTRMLNKRGWKR